MKLSATAMLCALLAAACGNASSPTLVGTASAPATVAPSAAAPSPGITAAAATTVTSAAPATATPPPGAPLLEDGPITPGTYTYVLNNPCDAPPPTCPAQATPPPMLDIQVTVPAGFEAVNGFHAIDASVPESQDAALVMGWTTDYGGLYSDPCIEGREAIPDIPVGPTVNEFVDAIAVTRASMSPSQPTSSLVATAAATFRSPHHPTSVTATTGVRGTPGSACRAKMTVGTRGSSMPTDIASWSSPNICRARQRPSRPAFRKWPSQSNLCRNTRHAPPMLPSWTVSSSR